MQIQSWSFWENNISVVAYHHKYEFEDICKKLIHVVTIELAYNLYDIEVNIVPKI